jgi:hypothetical protein
VTVEWGLRPFEVDIMARFRAGGKWYASPKGEWIRGYLLTYGEGCPYEMWKEYARFASILGIRPGTYTSFKTYMWILHKKLGLIRLVRKEVGPRWFAKSYYAIAPGMENSPLWRSPMQYAYPKTDWKIKTDEEKRRLREKYRR